MRNGPGPAVNAIGGAVATARAAGMPAVLDHLGRTHLLGESDELRLEPHDVTTIRCATLHGPHGKLISRYDEMNVRASGAEGAHLSPVHPRRLLTMDVLHERALRRQISFAKIGLRPPDPLHGAMVVAQFSGGVVGYEPVPEDGAHLAFVRLDREERWLSIRSDTLLCVLAALAGQTAIERAPDRRDVPDLHRRKRPEASAEMTTLVRQLLRDGGSAFNQLHTWFAPGEPLPSWATTPEAAGAVVDMDVRRWAARRGLASAGRSVDLDAVRQAAGANVVARGEEYELRYDRRLWRFTLERDLVVGHVAWLGSPGHLDGAWFALPAREFELATWLSAVEQALPPKASKTPSRFLARLTDRPWLDEQRMLAKVRATLDGVDSGDPVLGALRAWTPANP